MNEKAEQDARAFIRSHCGASAAATPTRRRPPSTKSASYTETEAKEAGLVDLVARDVPDLLAQLEGRTFDASAAAAWRLSR